MMQGRAHTWPAAIARKSARHPFIVALIAAALMGLAIAQISRTRVDGSLQAMLGAQSPAAAALARITSDYRRLDDLLILATLPPTPVANQSPRRDEQRRLLAFAQRLEESINGSPSAAALCRHIRYRTDPALSDFIQNVMAPAGAFYLEDTGFDALLHRLKPDQMREQIARNESLIAAPGPAADAVAKAVLRDPLRLRELIDDRSPSLAGLATNASSAFEFSDDGRSLLIRVSGVRPANDLYFAQRFVAEISACAAQANLDGLQIDIGGSYAIGAFASKTIRDDDISSAIATIILIQVFFIVFYRRAMAPLIIAGTAAVGIVIAFGIHATFVSTITPLTAVAAATLAGLGVDYGIHFLSHYQEYRRGGLSIVEATATTMRIIGLAMASACLTTLLGFAALWTSNVGMIRDFALLGSLGLLGALIATYTVMPALLALTDRRPVRAAPKRLNVALIAAAVAARPKTWIAISLLMLSAATAALVNAGGWPELESDLTVMHPRPNPPLDATELVARKFAAMGDSVLIEVRADTDEQLIAATHDVAAALRHADDSSLYLQEVLGLNRLLPDPRAIVERRSELEQLDPDEIFSGFDEALRESIFASDAYDDYSRFLAQLIAPSNAPGLADVLKYPSLAEQMLPRESLQSASSAPRTILVARLSQPIHDRSSRDAVIEGFHRALDGVTGVAVTGTDAVAHELEQTIRHDLPRTLAISLGLVILWLFIVFRRPIDIVLSFIPVGFSTIVLLGFIAATGIQLNVINGVALPLLAGIAVDCGVFFVLAFHRHAANEGDHAPAFGVMCAAVIGTTITNIIGFGSLYWTHTPAVRTLGIVSAVGILAGLWGTLFLLLPLLLIRRKRSAVVSDGVISNHLP